MPHLLWCFARFAVARMEKLDSQKTFFKCSVRKFNSEIVTRPFPGMEEILKLNPLGADRHPMSVL